MRLKIRNIKNDDAQILYIWATDPLTRANSFNSQHIKWEDHLIWLKKKLNDPLTFMYLLLSENKPVGTVNFTKREKAATIGVAVAPEFRGKGFGAKIIKTASHKYQSNNNDNILAYIKKENIASLQVFKKAGYVFFKEDIFNNHPCKILILKP